MNWETFVFEGKPFEDVFVFDVHGHIGAHKPFSLGDYDADGVAATCRRMGVNGVVISSIPSMGSDWKWGNEEVAAACKAHPDVLYGYAVPNPYYADCDLSPYMEMPGFCGIKIHGSFQNAEIDDPRYDHAYELADKKGVPVLFHAWMASEIQAVVNVAKRWPNVPMILGHAGMTARAAATEAVRSCENIFCDTAISATYDNTVELLADKIGVDRIVYGSDVSFFDCIHTLGKIALTKLSDDDKEKILGLTAKGLFRL